mgnify:CR=1 FL=1
MVDIALPDLAVRRLVEMHLADWRTAYERFTGPGFNPPARGCYPRHLRRGGAAAGRRHDVARAVAFLAEIRRIVTSAIEANGGTVRLTDAAIAGA